MIYSIFIILSVGILTYKFATKLKWEEQYIKRTKERRKKWLKKQNKRKPYGNKIRKRSKPPTRKRTGL